MAREPPIGRYSGSLARDERCTQNWRFGFADQQPWSADCVPLGRRAIGGLVDVNHVPGDVLASCLGLTPRETAAVVAARDQFGRFTSPEELSLYAQLSPDRVDALRDWMLFY